MNKLKPMIVCALVVLVLFTGQSMIQGKEKESAPSEDTKPALTLQLEGKAQSAKTKEINGVYNWGKEVNEMTENNNVITWRQEGLSDVAITGAGEEVTLCFTKQPSVCKITKWDAEYAGTGKVIEGTSYKLDSSKDTMTITCDPGYVYQVTASGDDWNAVWGFQTPQV